MIPVRQCRNDETLEVADDRVERLAVFRSGGGKRLAQRARRHAREDGVVLRGFEVVGDPVDECVPVPTEFV